MKVVHFEIPADQPEKLVDFYARVFDWKIRQWNNEPYWLADTGPKDKMGIGGAIYRKNPEMSRMVNTVGVDNLNESVEKVKKAGGRIIKEPMEIPGIGMFAYGEDPEGNPFGIMEPSKEMMNM